MTRKQKSILQTAAEQYRRDLPELLRKHRGKWVAYHGEKRLGIYEDDEQVAQSTEESGLNVNDIYCRLIEEERPNRWISPRLVK